MLQAGRGWDPSLESGGTQKESENNYFRMPYLHSEVERRREFSKG
jgi:hypothetical protein